jgi:hypothetical protein
MKTPTVFFHVTRKDIFEGGLREMLSALAYHFVSYSVYLGPILPHFQLAVALDTSHPRARAGGSNGRPLSLMVKRSTKHVL